jgi:UDP-4-amino-4,6-dideoxy-N-acetyl-beta-L-altrosamine N-acetyltransferase
MIEVCQIRAVKVDDLPILLVWRNHPEIRRYMLTQHEITLEEHKKWFAINSHDKTKQLLLVLEEDLPIGYVQFSKVKDGGVADWGFYASPQSLKGAGHKIGKTALKYAFEVLRLNKICGQALDFNHISQAFHLRLGFTKEGILKDQCQVDGKYHDLICFGLTNVEWRANEKARNQ